MEKQKRRTVLEEMILRHLQGNPDAGDTLEGITKWWLEMERIDISVNLVAKACQDLIQRGLIKKQNSPDGTIIYKAKKKKN